VVAQIVGHQPDFPPVLFISGFGRNDPYVFVIHSNDEVEAVEVRAVQLLGATVEVIAMLVATAAHPAVRQVTYMPWSDGSRLNVKLVR
jgi:hypothetical protein